MDNMNEMLFSMDETADKYFNKYKSTMEDFEKGSLLGKLGTIKSHDYVMLGKMLESFDVVKQMNEATGGTINSMGILPSIAYDVIALSYGSSPLALISSVQPVEEANGRVYFKQVKGGTTKGNITAGDTLIDPRNVGKVPQNYSGGNQNLEDIGTGDGSTVTFAGTLTYVPVLGTIAVTVEDSTTVFCQDQGDGTLTGPGVTAGTINYTTKAISITFAAAPANTKDIFATYYINYEGETDIPKLQTNYDSVAIKCVPFALKSEIGLMTNYSMAKRFGFSPKDSMALDLANEIGVEVIAKLITSATTACPSANKTTYTKAAPSGVSYAAHKFEFEQKILDIENLIAGSAGRGGVSALVCGTLAASVIAGLPDFKKVMEPKDGIHVYGTFKGMPVIRVNDPNVLAIGKCLTVYKSGSPFDAALYYAPYMPLIITDLLPSAPNPLGSMRGAASWSAQDVMVEKFIGEITVS